MENEIVLQDTIRSINQTITVQPNSSLWDNVYNIAMVVIALANICLVVYIFIKDRKRNEQINEKNRKIGLMKTLLLDYNMKHLYEFFDSIVTETNKLKKKDICKSEKQDIDSNIQDCCKNLRLQFIDAFLAVNQGLYDKILEKSDNLQGHLSKIIFDEGYNLSDKTKFDELITKQISETKTDILKILFEYNG